MHVYVYICISIERERERKRERQRERVLLLLMPSGARAQAEDDWEEPWREARGVAARGTHVAGYALHQNVPMDHWLQEAIGNTYIHICI